MPVPAMTGQRPAADSAAPDLLRISLRIDSWSTAVFGVVMLVGSELLSGPLGLPKTWSIPFGIAMLGGAAALALIAGYPRFRCASPQSSSWATRWPARRCSCLRSRTLYHSPAWVPPSWLSERWWLRYSPNSS
ncbi:hypothetical protein NKH18_13805 [Streptomyces sp. M10(2022)]